ncbi:hypothetical protein [Microbacterium sp. SORGH_AS_0888]|uniref:hypothetical protein n=1 Tax=Microbacterium sp. SORGH_AS_0888 TaxID=3041791 RepID=UPI002784CBB6|nr:hypothetical protein [Microbacterium sp. SORGH_AS_0888]MDQ1130275.1 hypothetical protein [Microbacterium sp. SORGH_AS_0888]
MRRRTAYAAASGTAVALALAGALAAQALWSSSMTVPVADMSVGSVGFSAYPFGASDSAAVSDAGEAVSVALPGSRLIELTQRSIYDTEPLIWRFVARGAALGIAGMDYRVSVSSQRTPDETYDLSSGHAKPGTLLAQSTVKVYRAALGGDCSDVPATPSAPEGQTTRNVYVFGGDGVVLQEPGAALAAEQTEQEWCAALSWNNAPDGLYRNDATVNGTAEDGGATSAIAHWQAVVGFPPSLDMLGRYLSGAVAEGRGEDGTRARGYVGWNADLYPDPTGEPDIVITLSPTVTSVGTTHGG